MISRTTFTRDAVRLGLARLHRVKPEMVILPADMPEICGWVDDTPKPKNTGRMRGKKTQFEQVELPI